MLEYLGRMRQLADQLLELCAAALGLDRDFFTRYTGHATHTLNINWYPPIAVAGEPEPGQFRIGPHTDFGTVTVLDREPGLGGLQVWTESDGWQDAPYDPAAFTINTGDLLARWSGDRWKSNRHRVLPPRAEAPDEDLVSLVYFYEADVDAVIESLRPPIGRPNDYEPVESAGLHQDPAGRHHHGLTRTRCRSARSRRARAGSEGAQRSRRSAAMAARRCSRAEGSAILAAAALRSGGPGWESPRAPRCGTPAGRPASWRSCC